MEITQETISFLLGLIALISVLFNIYEKFRKPQIRTDQTTVKITEDIVSLQRQIGEIKETHLKSVESDIKSLTSSVNDLSKTVVRLATIIDERIPKTTSSIPQAT